jgi:hypothetical protein
VRATGGLHAEDVHEPVMDTLLQAFREFSRESD